MPGQAGVAAHVGGELAQLGGVGVARVGRARIRLFAFGPAQQGLAAAGDAEVNASGRAVEVGAHEVGRQRLAVEGLQGEQRRLGERPDALHVGEGPAVAADQPGAEAATEGELEHAAQQGEAAGVAQEAALQPGQHPGAAVGGVHQLVEPAHVLVECAFDREDRSCARRALPPSGRGRWRARRRAGTPAVHAGAVRGACASGRLVVGLVDPHEGLVERGRSRRPVERRDKVLQAHARQRAQLGLGVRLGAVLAVAAQQAGEAAPAPAQQRGLGVGGQRVVGDRDDLPRAAGAGARGGGLRRRVRRGRVGSGVRAVLIVLPQACKGQKSSSAGRATAITIASSGRPMRQ